MNTANHIKVQPQDLIAWVKHTLGYTPTNSICILPMQGQSISAVLRLDLPKNGTPIDVEKFINYLKPQKPSAAMIMVYSDEPGEDHAPASMLVYGLGSALQDINAPMYGALLVTPDWWGHYGEQEKRDLADADNGNFATTAKVMGLEAQSYPDVLPATEVTEESLLLISVLSQSINEPSDMYDLTCFEFEKAFEVLSRAHKGGDEFTGDDRLALISILQHANYRDVIGAKLIHEGVTSETLKAVLQGSWEGPINLPYVKRSRTMLAQLLPYVPDEYRASALSIMGWLSLNLGEGTVAKIYLDEVDKVSPGYNLARLLRRLNDAGFVPRAIQTPPTR